MDFIGLSWWNLSAMNLMDDFMISSDENGHVREVLVMLVEHGKTW